MLSSLLCFPSAFPVSSHVLDSRKLSRRRRHYFPKVPQVYGRGTMQTQAAMLLTTGMLPALSPPSRGGNGVSKPTQDTWPSMDLTQSPSVRSQEWALPVALDLLPGYLNTTSHTAAIPAPGRWPTRCGGFPNTSQAWFLSGSSQGTSKDPMGLSPPV